MGDDGEHGGGRTFPSNHAHGVVRMRRARMKSSAGASVKLEDLLPNLIIPGAAKAGTTTIHNFLAQHPRIFLPRAKEPHFFCLYAIVNILVIYLTNCVRVID